MATILFVENDPDQLELRTLILEREGHVVQPAASASEALQALPENLDFAIVDLRIPSLDDGLYLIRELNNRAPQARVLVLTGLASQLEQRPESKLVHRVLKKPVRAAVLSALLKSAVALLALAAGMMAGPLTVALPKPEETAVKVVAGGSPRLAAVSVDGKPHSSFWVVSSAPRAYRIHLGRLPAGTHRIEASGATSLELDRQADPEDVYKRQWLDR